jgi:hypothetical protein
VFKLHVFGVFEDELKTYTIKAFGKEKTRAIVLNSKSKVSCFKISLVIVVY